MASTPAAKATDTASTEVSAPSKMEAKTPELVDYVQYIGPATQRILSEEDWDTVGATDQKAVEWNFGNDFRIPVAEFTDKALQYLVHKDDRMIVIKAEARPA